MQGATAELSYGHPSRLLVTFGFLIVPLVVVVILFAAVRGLVSGGGYWHRTQGVIVLLIGIYMCYGLREWIRGRHAYRTTYLVGDTGVRVVEPGKEPQLIHWEEFSSGIHKKLLPAVVLFSPHIAKPVTFFNNGTRGTSRDFEHVRDLAVGKLGARMRTRWL
jgi:hypothetical protein